MAVRPNGAAIKALRKLKGLSQTELGELCGKGKRIILNAEKGKEISEKTLEAIALHLETNVDNLINPTYQAMDEAIRDGTISIIRQIMGLAEFVRLIQQIDNIRSDYTELSPVTQELLNMADRIVGPFDNPKYQYPNKKVFIID